MKARRLSDFLVDEGAMSAMEFGLVVPIFLLLFAGATELSAGFMAQRRINHIAAVEGNLASKMSAVSMSELNDIFAASTVLLEPFPTATLGLRLTSVTQQKSGAYTVDWSEVSGTGLSAYTKGSSVSTAQVPAGMLQAAGDTVIVSDIIYVFNSPVAFFSPVGYTFQQSSYSRPRIGVTIACSDC